MGRPNQHTPTQHIINSTQHVAYLCTRQILGLRKSHHVELPTGSHKSKLFHNHSSTLLFFLDVFGIGPELSTARHIAFAQHGAPQKKHQQNPQQRNAAGMMQSQSGASCCPSSRSSCSSTARRRRFATSSRESWRKGPTSGCVSAITSTTAKQQHDCLPRLCVVGVDSSTSWFSWPGLEWWWWWWQGGGSWTSGSCGGGGGGGLGQQQCMHSVHIVSFATVLL